MRSLLGLVLLLATGASAQTLAPISAQTLSGREVSVPDQMPAQRSILVFGFKQSHTKEFDAWRGPLAQLAKKEGVDWVELPFVDVGKILKAVIRAAMNATMSDDLTREHFAPVWDSPEATKVALGIESDEQVVVVVCDETGTVLARVDGDPTAEAIATLTAAL